VRICATLLLLGTVAMALPAFPQDKTDCAKGECVVFLNAKTEERKSCVIDLKGADHDRTCRANDDDQSSHYLVQGKRNQLRVVNRKFFSAYTFTIDGVTQLKQIAIQDLEEAASLQTPLQSATPAVTKGAAPKGLSTAGQLTLRTAQDILAELVDEGRASNPVNELESDWLVVDRERRKVDAEVAALDHNWILLNGNGQLRECHASLGAPTIPSALSCLQQLYATETTGDFLPNLQNPGLQCFRDEDRFRALTVQIGDAITLVKTLGNSLLQSSGAMSNNVSALDSDLAAWKADLNTLRGNVAAANDAYEAFAGLINDARRENVLTPLRRAQIKLKLMQDLNGGAAGAKPALDDAELNRLVDAYLQYSKNFGQTMSAAQRLALGSEIHKVDEALGAADPTIAATTALVANQTHLYVDLPAGIDAINASQSQVLGRANEIYDHSAVEEPFDIAIDLSKNTGNLHVYYTVRRVDVFPRYTVPVISNGPQAAAPLGAPLPPPATGIGNNTTATPNVTGQDVSTGQVVAHGSLDVHDFYRATVVAAFAFSIVKDVTVSSKSVTTGQANDGSACNSTAPCSQPFLDQGGYIPSLLVGVNYYLSRNGHDTFPGAKRSIGQRLGIFGGAAANRLNSYFLGMGVEPTEAVQFTGGINFVTIGSLSGAYSTSQVYPGSPSFNGPSQWAKGGYFSLGFNLSIFRKIFGSVTGLGTKATGAGN
jgi:hypothetical protein